MAALPPSKNYLWSLADRQFLRHMYEIAPQCRYCEKRAHSLTADVCEAHRTQPVLPTATAGRNDPCPCGSGRKRKHCEKNHPSPLRS